MKLEERLSAEDPEIFHSKVLSKKAGHGIKVDVMYFGNTETGSHKGKKGQYGLNYVNDMGGDYALIITGGNAGYAFDVKSIDYDIQVVKFINKNRTKKLIDIEKIGKDRFGKDRYGITIRLPDKWFDSKKLEKFWRELVHGKKRKYRKYKKFNKLMEVIKKRNLNPLNAFDVTNIREMYPSDKEYFRNGGSPYKTPETWRAVRKYDVIVDAYGSGEHFSVFQEERKNMSWFERLWYGKPILIAVTSCGNVVSNKFRPIRTRADKLDVAKVGREHNINIAAADNKTYFLTIPSNKVISKAYKLMRRCQGLKTSPSGSICSGIFDASCVEHSKAGLVIKDTYRFDPHKIDFYKKIMNNQPLVIKPKSKVLLVNTGGLN